MKNKKECEKKRFCQRRKKRGEQEYVGAGPTQAAAERRFSGVYGTGRSQCLVHMEYP